MTSRVERINSGVNACSDVFEHFVATWAVPVADGVVAVLAANNMATVLGFPLAVSIMAGVALEGVGIVSSKAALECHWYNQTRGNKPPVLERLAWAVAGVQFCVGFALILVNAVMVNQMVLGLLSIGLLSATGTLAHMLRSDVRARQGQQQPAPVVASVAAPVASVAEDVAPIDEMTPRARVLAFYAANPDATQEEAAEACGMCRQRVSQWLKQLAKEGAISRNGHVEVLADGTGGR